MTINITDKTASSKTAFAKSFSVIVSLSLLLSSLTVIQGCSQNSTKGKKPVVYLPGTENMTANQLLTKARSLVKANEQEKAIKYYETLEARFPLTPHAQQALLEIAHTYYKTEEPDQGLDTVDRFIRMYPDSKNMDYALYLRGLINFNRGKNLLDRVFPRNFADLDSVRQKESFHDFSKLATRYPRSQYVKDAKARILYLRNALADTEVNVAEYYYKRGAYLAAFNRAEYTIKHYDGSPAVIKALQVKILSAEKLGKKDIAAVTRRVLESNFPKHARF